MVPPYNNKNNGGERALKFMPRSKMSFFISGFQSLNRRRSSFDGRVSRNLQPKLFSRKKPNLIGRTWIIMAPRRRCDLGKLFSSKVFLLLSLSWAKSQKLVVIFICRRHARPTDNPSWTQSWSFLIWMKGDYQSLNICVRQKPGNSTTIRGSKLLKFENSCPKS